MTRGLFHLRQRGQPAAVLLCALVLLAGCSDTPEGPEVLSRISFTIDLCRPLAFDANNSVIGCVVPLEPWAPEVGATKTWSLPANVTGVSVRVKALPAPAAVTITAETGNLTGDIEFVAGVERSGTSTGRVDPYSMRLTHKGAGRVCGVETLSITVSGVGLLPGWIIEPRALVTNMTWEALSIFPGIPQEQYCQPTWRVS